MNCRRFAREVASGAERSGVSGGGFGFWWHWAVCRFCRQYWAELRLIAAEAAKSSPPRDEAAEVASMKERMRSNLKRKMR